MTESEARARVDRLVRAGAVERSSGQVRDRGFFTVKPATEPEVTIWYDTLAGWRKDPEPYL